MRYQRNEYDWCVMNKIIDNKQCTILWHVYNLKKSHVETAVVSSVLANIDAEYGKICKNDHHAGQSTYIPRDDN